MEVNASLINFAAGQLSKKFLARIDLPNFYKAGALLCRNFIPQAQGPVEYRSGSKYVMHTRANGETGLFPFVFNDDQAYALAFSDQKLRFFSDGGVVLSSAGALQSQLLIHFDGADGATTYTAESGQTVTFNGDAQLDTAVKHFGTASLMLDGTGDYVTVPGGSDWDFADGDFTLDFRARFNDVTTAVQSVWTHGSNGQNYAILKWLGAATNTWEFSLYTGNVLQLRVTAADTLANDTFYHVALVRNGNVWSIYRDGVSKGSTTQAQTYPAYSGVMSFGMEDPGITGSPNPMAGFLDEIRVVKGTAVWTSGFVPPTSAYSSTNLLAITGITQASPGVVTVDTHGLTTGDEIYVTDIEGMTELNDKFYLVVVINANTFSLTDVDGNAIDTTAYTAYTAGGTADKVYEIDTPYEEADVYDLKFAQKADLMYIVHPDYEPRKLTRSGDADWALATFTRTDDPFTKTITGITKADPGVVSAAAHGFEDGDIVEINGVVGMTEVNEQTFKVANKAAGTFELTDPTTGANIDTSAYAAYVSGGVVFKAGNMPGAVAFYGGRLFYGGTDDDPETFFGSKAPDNDGTTNYDVFTVGASEEDAVIFPISSQNNMADRIQWFAGTSRFLAIGTFGGVYKANGGSDSEPISGIAINVRAVEFIGCKYVAPTRIGNSLFYVQRGGQILNRFGFSFLADDYAAENLNVFSDEITSPGLKQLAVQQGRADILWATTTDGNIIGVTVKTGEEINAWHSHTIGGTDIQVLSVCGEPQPDNMDSLWLVAERTIDGVTRRYVEYFEAEDLLPEREEYYTGTQADDDDKYRNLLYEAQKSLVRLDSALSLNTLQTSPVTPGATTGTGIAFTSTEDVFASGDVGKKIIKKFITGEESGIATITAYVSATEVTCTVNTDFDSTDIMAENEWFLATNAVTGLDHLEGETVAAQVDGADDGTFTVTDGAITLNTYGTIIHVGLEYTGRLQTMPLDIGALAGTAQARITTVNRLGILFRHARGTKYGSELYRLEELKDRDLGAITGRPAQLITEAKFLELASNYLRRQYIYIVQDTPAPCAVQGIVPFVDTTNE